MKVCYFGTFEKDYPRNITFIESLRKVGVSVEVCNVSLNVEKRGFGKFSHLIKLFLRYIKAYSLLFLNAVKIKCDAVIIGYPAHLDVLMFFVIFKLRHIPIFFNPLVSLYDTFVFDRKIFKSASPIAKLIYFVDKLAFLLPLKVFIDTKAHRDYLTKLFKIPEDKFVIVPVGALEDFFMEDISTEKREPFQVLYCGKYIPLHGVETVVKAANLLKDKEINFVMIGTGQEYDLVRKIVKEGAINNIKFIEWLPPKDVSKEIRLSHIVLGIFKGEGKALRVVPNKIYDALASGAVVITGKTPAIKEFFEDGRDLVLVEPDNPEKLAEAILYIKENYAKALNIAKQGQNKVKQFASSDMIGALIKEVVQTFR